MVGKATIPPWLKELMLIVKPNFRAAAAKLSLRRCRASSELATRVQSSANRRSRMVESLTLVEALK